MHARSAVTLAVTLTLCRSLAAQSAAAPDTTWVARSALYEVFVKDFSAEGNFRGVIRGLDRIRATGANVIWLMPIHPVGVLNRKDPLGSPYAVRDYRAIDSAYGTAADFHALVSAAHARGMKVIIDWVPDHTSWDNAWITEHPDYYVHVNGAMTVPRDAEGHLTDWTDVVQLDYGNPALRRAMIDVMRWWLTEFDLDGFRVDVAGFVPDAFWREAIPELRGAVPRRILLLAEWASYEMHRDGFDLTYGWDGYSRLKAIFRGDTASTLTRLALNEAQNMPAGGMRMRFSTNHDETAWDNPPVTLFGGSAQARAAYVAIALLPGRPLLYNGQEIESPQKLRLFYRDTIAWRQPGAEQARAFYRRVIDLARTRSSFIAGALEGIETSAPLDLIAYRRDDAIVVVNSRGRAITATLIGTPVRRMRDLLSNRVQRGDTLTLPAYGAVVLVPRR